MNILFIAKYKSSLEKKPTEAPKTEKVAEEKIKNNIPIEEIEDLATKLSQFADKESEKEKIVEELKNMSFDKDMKPTSSVSKLTEILNFTSDVGTENYVRVGFRHLKVD